MKVILDYLGEHIIRLHWTFSVTSFTPSPPKPPKEDNFPLQPVQSLRRAVLKVSESLEFLTVLAGRSRETGIPGLTILLNPHFCLF